MDTRQDDVTRQNDVTRQDDVTEHYVFVYGTVKRGFFNHRFMNGEGRGRARFHGTARTTVPLPLILATPFQSPFLLWKPHAGSIVQGEVYVVDEEMLQNMDEVEDVPNLFARERIEVLVSTGSGAHVMQCHCYALRKYPPALQHKPSHSEYTLAQEAATRSLYQRYVREHPNEDNNSAAGLNLLGMLETEAENMKIQNLVPDNANVTYH